MKLPAPPVPELFRALDRLAPAMVEQPLAHDDLLDHARLQRQILNVKPGVGGITPALEILEAGRESGVACWIGGMLESAIGASHCLALATLPYHENESARVHVATGQLNSPLPVTAAIPCAIADR